MPSGTAITIWTLPSKPPGWPLRIPPFTNYVSRPSRTTTIGDCGLVCAHLGQFFPKQTSCAGYTSCPSKGSTQNAAITHTCARRRLFPHSGFGFQWDRPNGTRMGLTHHNFPRELTHGIHMRMDLIGYSVSRPSFPIEVSLLSFPIKIDPSYLGHKGSAMRRTGNAVAWTTGTLHTCISARHQP